MVRAGGHKVAPLPAFARPRQPAIFARSDFETFGREIHQFVSAHETRGNGRRHGNGAGLFGRHGLGPVPRGSDGAGDLIRQRHAFVGVGHDGGALASVGVHQPERAETHRRTGVAEFSRLARVRNFHAQAPGIGLAAQHPFGRGLAQQRARLAAQRAHQRDGEAGKIRRRRPQAGRGLFRINAPAAGDGRAVGQRSGRGAGAARGVARRQVVTVGHAGGAQHLRAQVVGEGLAGRAFHQVLHQHEAATRIAPARAGRVFHLQARGVCGRRAVEYLAQAGHRRTLVVTLEAGHVDAGRVREQVAQVHGPLAGGG